MAFVKIWIHAVWGTKNREPLLTTETRIQLCDHIKQNARIKGFFIDTINGYTDHLHCLMPLNADMSISKQMQLIKGESAFWMNRNSILKTKFAWADGYFAASVSENSLHKVRQYIQGQEEHHRKITFTDEYNHFLKEFGFNVIHG